MSKELIQTSKELDIIIPIDDMELEAGFMPLFLPADPNDNQKIARILNNSLSKGFAESIKGLSELFRLKLFFFINSIGGSEGIAEECQLAVSNPCQSYAVVRSKAYSAAGLLSMSCEKILTTSDSDFMFHPSFDTHNPTKRYVDEFMEWWKLQFVHPAQVSAEFKAQLISIAEQACEGQEDIHMRGADLSRIHPEKVVLFKSIADLRSYILSLMVVNHDQVDPDSIVHRFWK